jgi:PAS domain S-box-containing protein
MVQSSRAVAADSTSTAVQLIGIVTACAIVPALIHNGARALWGPVAALAIEEAVVLSCLVLNRKGAPRLASRILTLSSVALAATLTSISSLGVHSVAILIYPAAIVISGALLHRSWFAAVSLTCMAALALQYVLEWSGVRTCVLSQYVELRFLVDAEAILAVTALATRLLVSSLHKSLLQAQSSEQLLSESEARYRTLDVLATKLLARIAGDDGFILDDVICGGLAEIATYFGAELALLSQFQDGKTAYSITHEWCSSASHSRKQQIQNVPIGASPWIEGKILAGECIVIPRLSDAPPDAAESRKRWEALGIRTLMQVPFRGRKGVILGGMGMYTLSCEHDWRPEDARRLGLLADAMASVMERKLAEERLRDSTRRYETLVENSPDIIARFDRDVRYQFVNSAIRRVSPLTPDDFKGKTMAEVGFTREQADKRESMIRGVIASGVPVEAELEADARGELRVYEWRACPELDSAGVVQSVLTFNRDITDRKRADEEHQLLQTQLNRAQRMESIGQLAGGVAHDFNNLLGVILGETELTLDDLSNSDPRRAPLERIQQAARRSAALTRQLLAFARRQPIAPEVLDLNTTLEGMLHMFRRLIGEDIALTWNPGCDLWPVRIDPSQIDQLLANLCVNARDAIAGVGRVTIETSNATFENASDVHSGDGAPGDYVELAVSDDGCGMSSEVQERVFEPFFTTKDLGKGTGLGLSTVYGIVRQNDGFITVDSEPGQGATFRIYLRRHRGPTPAVKVPSWKPRPLGQGETVLLVEDEPSVLSVAQTMLERLGFRVLSEATPRGALDTAAVHGEEIRLLVTDVIMPEMNGRELFERLSERLPGLKCLYVSGYTADVIAPHGVLTQGVWFLPKPFTMQSLSAKLLEVLADRDNPETQ